MRTPSTYSHSFALPAEIDRTFALFSDSGRLDTLTPDWFDLRPRPPMSKRLAPGVEIRYRLRWRGLPLPWTSLIVEWQPPHRLTYEQVRGPYRFFRHEHLFVADGDGTRVIDRVVYEALGGAWIDRLLIRPDLERIFRHRARVARTMLGSLEREPQTTAL